jgi:hypothetical protein
VMRLLAKPDPSPVLADTIVNREYPPTDNAENDKRGLVEFAADQARPGQENGPCLQSGMKFIATPLMQYRWCVGGGPSSKTCPR